MDYETETFFNALSPYQSKIHEVALLLGPFFNAECVLVADLASMWRHHQQRRESELGLFFEQKIQVGKNVKRVLFLLHRLRFSPATATPSRVF